MRKYNRLELSMRGENICSITKEKCHKKILCKDCDICKEYKSKIF